jgi:hypothetical protein
MNNYWIVPTFVFTIMACVMLVLLGANMENRRLYKKCLETNGTLQYNEAILKCEENVK